MTLDEEQVRLLADLVEADRRLPRDKRIGFVMREIIGPPGMDVGHPQWPKSRGRAPRNDVYALVAAGALREDAIDRYGGTFWVTTQGLAIYEEYIRAKGEPVERVVSTIRQYIDSEAFRQRHPRAFQKWSEAESHLWSDDSEKNLTVIGHLCREAMQEFAASLLRIAKLKDFNPDPAKTVDRLRAVIAARRTERGDTTSAFNDALVAYWGTMSDLVQKQEHGSQAAGRSLTWEDARRVVFHLMVVMQEIDSAVR